MGRCPRVGGMRSRGHPRVGGAQAACHLDGSRPRAVRLISLTQGGFRSGWLQGIALTLAACELAVGGSAGICPPSTAAVGGRGLGTEGARSLQRVGAPVGSRCRGRPGRARPRCPNSLQTSPPSPQPSAWHSTRPGRGTGSVSRRRPAPWAAVTQHQHPLWSGSVQGHWRPAQLRVCRRGWGRGRVGRQDLRAQGSSRVT